MVAGSYAQDVSQSRDVAGSEGRSTNLLGALAVAVGDRSRVATEDAARRRPLHGRRSSRCTVLAGDQWMDLRRVVGLIRPGGAARGQVWRPTASSDDAGANGRAVSLVLTSNGHRAARRVLAARWAALDRVLGELSEAECRAFERIAESCCERSRWTGWRTAPSAIHRRVGTSAGCATSPPVAATAGRARDRPRHDHGFEGHGNMIGTLPTIPATERLDLLAPVVAAAVTGAVAAGVAGIADVHVAEIDPGLADTAAMSAAYGVALEMSANCVIVTGRRGGEARHAACVVLATTRADVNGLVRRRLAVRKASFAATDFAVSETGMEYGGITPVGLPELAVAGRLGSGGCAGGCRWAAACAVRSWYFPAPSWPSSPAPRSSRAWAVSDGHLDGQRPVARLGSREDDAAPARRRVEAGVEQVGAQRLGESRDQGQVHPADQLGVLAGKGVERAVRERDRGVVGARFEAVGAEGAAG